MSDAIAIIGMAGRWPRAKSRREFWINVRDGVDCISRFAAKDLEIADPPARMSEPDFVAARSVLEQPGHFDAEFFGIHPREAERIDPQHRVFLECCWEAFEDAGYVPETSRGAVGVFAGCSVNSYFLRQVCGDRAAMQAFVDEYPLGDYQTLLGGLADSLATRVAYKLNLRGPSMTIQTACSTSLVAVCQACQSLQNFQCDMALAGGVSITFPQKRGYRCQDGAMGSLDGQCRPFDAGANGTVFGSGAGVVLLKRLDDAMADGDSILAVIKGYAVNNDGSEKVGYTAPSLNGQASVIAMAHAMAEVNPESIAYLEAHGTATPLGDPIEIASLTQAFRMQTEAKQFCALGTAKANVGHLEAAAGVTGLINAVHALVHEQLPPLRGFESPNANLHLENSPFYVNTKPKPWKRSGQPRCAGVSSFGIGGTNAHVVLEEGPPVPREPSARPTQIIALSARTEAALESARVNLTRQLKEEPEAELADVAFTLQTGRRQFSHRMAVVCSSVADAISALEESADTRLLRGVARDSAPPVVFLFPGQGSQYVGMGADLYRSEPEFRRELDRCAEILKPHLRLDLREALFHADSATIDLTQTNLAQPALFTIEYALARLWMRWGVRPRGMIGHSIGEFVAACLAGVFSLEDALSVVAARGRLMQEMAPGAMTAVRLPPADVAQWLNGELSLAAVNAPNACVVSGPITAISTLEAKLADGGVAVRRLTTSHAFHSRMAEPILEPFEACLRRVQFHKPQIPFVSGVTGQWITAEEATSPAYWARHLRETVQFSKGIETLRELPKAVFLEVGPGRVLSNLAKQHFRGHETPIAVASLPMDASADESRSLLSAAGTLWVQGVSLDWSEMHDRNARRCSLPTYPFERKRYWIDPPSTIEATMSKPPMPEEQDKSFQPDNAVTGHSSETASGHPPIAGNRAAALRNRLVLLFEELSGLNLSTIDPSTSFLELGFDSLSLTQIAQAIRSRFGVPIAFRQLLDQQSTISALADYLESRMPPDVATAQTSTANTLSATGPASDPAVPTGVEALMREQLQVLTQFMARQLEVVRGAVPATAEAPAPQAALPSTNPEFKAFGPYKPIQKGSAGSLSEQQTAFVEALIQRYSAKTAESKRQTQDRRSVLADPRVAAGFRVQWKEIVYPIVTVRSRGSRLWDVDGNEYIDLLNGFGPILFGHAPDFVTDALTAQLRDGFEIGPQTPLAGEVAALVCELTGNERATFCNTGSEAVMAALRVARTVTGRNKIVLFAGAYHGTFDEVLGKGITRKGQPASVPIAPGIPNESLANVTVLEYGKPESLDFIRRNAESLAAVLVEPIQSRHPELRPVEFLRQVRQITEASGTALIFDEIVTGFRTHPGGAQALFGIRADLATYGKVAGGGMPIGILAGRARFMDALDGGMWQYGDASCPEAGVTFFAGTFVRHPLALAASRAVLRRLKNEGPELQRSLNEKTTALIDSLNAFLQERGLSLRIGHFASWFYFGFSADQPYGSLLYYLLREKGIHIQEGFPCFLTTAHSKSDIETFRRAFEESIIELQSAGFLASVAPVASQPASLNETAPLTEPQVEVLLSARLSDEASCAFNEAVAVRLRGSLDPESLRLALQSLVVRHDALRSRIEPRTNDFRVHEAVTVELPMSDWSDLTAADRDARLAEAIDADAARPFDLAAGPLIRFHLFRQAADDNVLLMTAHHIVCDGWSTNVLLAELGQVYGSMIDGSPLNLTPAVSFRDYAQEHRRRKSAPEHAAVESWWVEQFTSLPAPLELPTDRPRGPVRTFGGGTVRRTIGKTAYRAIKQFGARQGCTLFATLLAGFNALLHRLTGQTDIVIGIPAAGQSVLDSESLVGHYVNFLPIRTAIADDETGADLLARVRRTLLDAYDHQDYTYGSLIHTLGGVRDPSRLPLIEVQFNLERVGTGLQFAGLQVDVDPCPKRFVNFDLFLNAVESADGLVIDCDYNSDLFDAGTIERWLGHYETLVEQLTAHSIQPIATLPILRESEQRQLIADWNATDTDYPRERCLHQLIDDQAARTPESPAIVCGEKSISYAELRRDSDRIADWLVEHGIGVGDRVAICLDRSLGMVLAALGIVKAGAAYVPLDPDFPVERIQLILDDAAPALVIGESDSSRRLGIDTARFAAVSEILSGGELKSPLANQRPPKPADLAYVIYTSGSTGKPKGVEVSHRAIVNLLSSMARVPGMCSDDRLVAVTTLCFDIATLELFLPLCVGAQVIIATRTVVADGRKLLELLETSGATVMQATPATWRLLIDGGWTGHRPLKVLCGGEALTRQLADELLARSQSVWNMYGPTETTVWSATAPVTSGPGPVTIGPPIANTQFYVRDRNGQIAPIGVAGELWIGGDGVAAGYRNLPQLTAERFVADPYRIGGNNRLYRTGDLVRSRPDRTLEFLGRLDTQVKVRGFRIETGEVEHYLKQCPGIRECLVTARETAPGDVQLVAYVAGATTDSTQLRAFLAARVPAYMVPSLFCPIASLPRHPNGKVDWRSLPAPKAGAAVERPEPIAPRNAAEQKLIAICAEVLKVDRLGIHDSLFEFGADSIQVFQIVARANDAGLAITPTQVLAGRHVAAICGKLDAEVAETGRIRIAPVARDQYRQRGTTAEVFAAANGRSPG